ncbi:hypothetical protein COLO4_04075 [Corchorus olitorius]|uniref:Uncharacterized protein n=1 Tax=Corchorus olitorius TaxID=93759 RepID=A0A1R3KVC6_9ROSI|nr:hypothetical protein COLO4_04075 [Corchorus olitorius]
MLLASEPVPRPVFAARPDKRRLPALYFEC